ncbi:hypothetical protein NDU88_002841 [Pleurodeles waltl]|uniref:Uncharacterized protein n=1 Tax=Pleurodeles waltl TaxID=8319 RepID=A0AAV7TLU8_PLEWA|nr:hypothetical protein NDU88_002841 [Pleurodeles waltl]
MEEKPEEVKEDESEEDSCKETENKRRTAQEAEGKPESKEVDDCESANDGGRDQRQREARKRVQRPPRSSRGETNNAATSLEGRGLQLISYPSG